MMYKDAGCHTILAYNYGMAANAYGFMPFLRRSLIWAM